MPAQVATAIRGDCTIEYLYDAVNHKEDSANLIRALRNMIVEEVRKRPSDYSYFIVIGDVMPSHYQVGSPSWHLLASSFAFMKHCRGYEAILYQFALCVVLTFGVYMCRL